MNAVGKLQIHTESARLSLQGMRVLVNDYYLCTKIRRTMPFCNMILNSTGKLFHCHMVWMLSFLDNFSYHLYLITCKLHSIPNASIMLFMPFMEMLLRYQVFYEVYQSHSSKEYPACDVVVRDQEADPLITIHFVFT